MEQQEIIEGNKLIAEFMGAEVLSPKTKFTYYDFGDNWSETNSYVFQQKIHDNMLKYHSSWDWLIPIIDKIELIEDSKYVVQIAADRCTIFEWNDSENIVKFNVMHTGEKITATYKCIIEFIKWYNNGKDIKKG